MRSLRLNRLRHIERLEDRRLLAVVTVDTVSDVADGDSSTILSLISTPGPDGVISLREAITAANQTINMGGPDEIHFAIPGDGPHSIQVNASGLPPITDAVVIDGYTQGNHTPGDPNDDAVPNSSSGWSGLNSMLKVQLVGTATGSTVNGLELSGGSEGSTIRGLVIREFGQYGLQVATDNNTVEGNFVGTDVTGSVPAANGADGIRILGNDNVIGGESAAARNLISGNTGHGVFILGGARNVLHGNLIGTGMTGTAALPNVASGVIVQDGPDNEIGGPASGAGNLLSGNGDNGVTVILAPSSGTIIQGNRIGTDVLGLQPLGNGFDGVLNFQSPNMVIGGTALGEGNLISANARHGINLIESAGSVAQGNLIGVNRTGSQPLGNQLNGVELLNSNDITIGGVATGAGNVIAASGSLGIFIQGGNSGNLIAGNSIGTDDLGTPLGNLDGLFVSGNGVAIERNTIAHSRSGITVSFGTGNPISQNSIHSISGDLGIDLAPPTGPNFPQDADDSDTGGNNLQNFPVITSVTNLGTMARVEGTFTSQLNSDYRLEFFASTLPTASGFGAGETFLDDLVLAIGGGSHTVNFSVDVQLPPGQPYVSATATDITDNGSGPRNDTSEFSRAVPVDTIFAVTSTADEGSGSLREAINAANFVAGPQVINFDIPADDPNHLYYMDDGISGHVSQTHVGVTAATDDLAIADIDPDWPHSWYSIELASQLFLTDEIVVDGYTQPGSVANTQPVGSGLNSILRLEINGAAASLPSLDGLIHLATSNSTIRGLAINRSNGQKIQLESGSHNQITGNHIGTDVSGTVAFSLGNNSFPPVFAGIGTNHATPASPITNNRIGGITPASRNLISSNFSGVALLDTATNNFVEGNLIGSDRSGTRSLENTLGIWVESVGNSIGGPSPASGNLISGNDTGIELSDFLGNSFGNLVQHNLIGTDVSGTHPLENGLGILNTGSNDNQIVANTIAFNGLTRFTSFGFGGLRIVGVGNLVSANSIHSNQGNGIDLRGDDGVDLNDVPPQSDPPDQDTGGNDLQNYPVITSAIDTGNGTQVEGSLASTPLSNFRIEFFSNVERDDNPFLNYGAGRPFEYGEGKTFLGFVDIATDASGNANFQTSLPALPAGEEFVTTTATNVTDVGPGPLNNTSEFSVAYPLGGPSTIVTRTGEVGVGTLREALTVAGFEDGADTITFDIPPDDPNHVYYQDDGVAGQVSPARITVTTAADDTSILDIDPDWPHSWYAIQLDRPLAEIDHRVTIQGTTQPGSQPNSLPALGGLNTVLKVAIDGSQVGGDGFNLQSGAELSLIEGLVIHGFSENGIKLRTMGGNRIYGNFIGTDPSGTLDLGNGGDGVLLSADAVTRVGGSDPSMRNLISGNGLHGIEQRNSGGDQFQGNLIGTDRTATAWLPNDGDGVHLYNASFETIGGSEPGTGNVIAARNANGVTVFDSDFPQLGLPETSIVAFEPCRNAAQAVFDAREAFFASNSPADALLLQFRIGVLVACTLSQGVQDAYAQANSIIGNEIWIDDDLSSAQRPLAVDLAGDGVTLNDPLDADGGPNNLRNFPTLTSAETTDGTTTIVGTLQSVPDVTFRIEFFVNPLLSASGYGPGEQLLGFTEITTDGNGDAAFTFEAPQVLSTGQFVSATATYLVDLDLQPGTPPTPVETSEFAAAIAVSGPGPVCDFDGLDGCDIKDIDALIGEIVSGANGTLYDLTGDGMVDLADRDSWLAEAGALNLPSGNAYLLGDATLDGVVDGQDFLVWNGHKFSVTSKWSQADWNADGSTDGQDFLLWNANKFQTSDVHFRPTHLHRRSTRLSATSTSWRLASHIDNLFADLDDGQEMQPK